MKPNIIEEKSFAFAVEIIRVYLSLKEAKHYELASQLLRCGTSIGANVAEGVHAQSKSDFIHKLSISQKESNEVKYWLKLFETTHILDKETCQSLYADCQEIQRILTAILKSAKNSNT